MQEGTGVQAAKAQAAGGREPGGAPARRARPAATAGAVAAAIAALLGTAAPAAAQVQIRLGDPVRATYSELHEGLRPGTPSADTVQRIMGATDVRALWTRVDRAVAGKVPWNEALLGLTRIAELGDPGSGPRARRMLARLEAGKLRLPVGHEADELVQPLRAVLLELRRRREGDAALRAQILELVPSGDYALAEAWVLGRMGDGTADTLIRRFETARFESLKLRYLTLLTFSRDPRAIPFLARAYAAPDSAGVSPRFGRRASDALLWIGTREALVALRDARARARARGVYASPDLGQGGYDFLANDSSAVISRTGAWLDEWIARLPAAAEGPAR